MNIKLFFLIYSSFKPLISNIHRKFNKKVLIYIVKQIEFHIKYLEVAITASKFNPFFTIFRKSQKLLKIPRLLKISNTIKQLDLYYLNKFDHKKREISYLFLHLFQIRSN